MVISAGLCFGFSKNRRVTPVQAKARGGKGSTDSRYQGKLSVGKKPKEEKDEF